MMRARTWITFTILAASMPAGTAAAEISGERHFEENRFYLTPFVGWTFFDSDRRFARGSDLSDDVYFGGRAGVRLTRLLWLDLAGGYTRIKDCQSCPESWTHYSANLMLGRETWHTINPFLSLGGGWSTFKNAVGTTDNSGTFEAAAGLRVRLTNALGLRLEARNVLALSKTNSSKSRMDDIVVGGGLTFGFGGKSRVIDSDGDGVPDSKDNCPDTPLGCQVDARGCPLDSDGDGVYDCIDRCSDTPKGCHVDLRGCPIDSDNDGVCDGLDNCPNTLSGCQVDAHGCPIDSDGDGVCDGRDKCPNTATDTKVDQDGCPLIGREQQLELELLNTGLLRISNINFDYDKSTIRPDAFAVLDTVGKVLTKRPGLMIEIDGHTDSRGSDAYNVALSHRRAESVRAYLLEHFSEFSQTQITAQGYGERKPLVPNDSPDNMQLNRRVEFVVLNKEILKGQK